MSSVYNDAYIKPRFLTYSSPPHLHKYWLDNCPIKTFYANMIALYIPSVETFFIRSVRNYLPQIHDPKLKQDIKNFIQQEANHKREYSAYVENSIAQFYPELSKLRRPSWLLKILSVLGGPQFRLALTCAAEHFTAVCSDLLLRDPAFFEGIPPEIAQIWQWHSVEEIEHKGVAYDAYAAVSGNYVIRVFSFMVMTLVLVSACSKVYWHMMKADNLHKDKDFYRRTKYFFWNKPGFLRNLIKPYFAYFKPYFHPWQQNNADLIKQWEHVLPKPKRHKAVMITTL